MSSKVTPSAIVRNPLQIPSENKIIPHYLDPKTASKKQIFDFLLSNLKIWFKLAYTKDIGFNICEKIIWTIIPVFPISIFALYCWDMHKRLISNQPLTQDDAQAKTPCPDTAE